MFSSLRRRRDAVSLRFVSPSPSPSPSRARGVRSPQGGDEPRPDSLAPRARIVLGPAPSGDAAGRGAGRPAWPVLVGLVAMLLIAGCEPAGPSDAAFDSQDAPSAALTLHMVSDRAYEQRVVGGLDASDTVTASQAVVYDGLGGLRDLAVRGDRVWLVQRPDPTLDCHDGVCDRIPPESSGRLVLLRLKGSGPPERLGDVAVASPARIRAIGDLLYVAQGAGGLSVFAQTVAPGGQPIAHLGLDPSSLGEATEIRDVTPMGAHTVLVTNHGLRIVAAPAGGTLPQVGFLPNTSQRRCVVYPTAPTRLLCVGYGDRRVAATPEGGKRLIEEPHTLTLVDLADPSVPQRLDASPPYDTLTSFDLAIIGARAYTLDDVGLSIWDCGNPDRAPTHLGAVGMHWPRRLRAVGSWLVVASAGVDNPPYSGALVQVFLPQGDTLIERTHVIPSLGPARFQSVWVSPATGATQP